MGELETMRCKRTVHGVEAPLLHLCTFPQCALFSPSSQGCAATMLARCAVLLLLAGCLFATAQANSKKSANYNRAGRPGAGEVGPRRQW